MNQNVVIKSYKKGIALHLDATADFEEILEEIRERFTESKSFFGSSVMVLSIEGRLLTEAEELKVIKAIHENSDMKISCLVGKDEAMEHLLLRAATQMETLIPAGEKGQLYKGNIENKEVLETESSIVIIGNVEAGSVVTSAGSIIVLGALRGEAYAGGNGIEGAFVAALEMEPERIRIGDFKYKPVHKKSFLTKKTKTQPEIAVLKNKRIVMEPFTNELLSLF